MRGPNAAALRMGWLEFWGIEMEFRDPMAPPDACPGCGDPDYEFRVLEIGRRETQNECSCGFVWGGQAGLFTFKQVCAMYGVTPQGRPTKRAKMLAAKQ